MFGNVTDFESGESFDFVILFAKFFLYNVNWKKKKRPLFRVFLTLSQLDAQRSSETIQKLLFIQTVIPIPVILNFQYVTNNVDTVSLLSLHRLQVL